VTVTSVDSPVLTDQLKGILLFVEYCII